MIVAIMPKVVVGLGLELIGLPWLAIGLKVYVAHTWRWWLVTIYIYRSICYLLGAEFFGHLKYWDLFGFWFLNFILELTKVKSELLNGIRIY